MKATFDQFNKMNILIIGDVMIDAYLWGKVDRISPEAPVPIVTVGKKEKRMGGAANVALNIHALGANPILCSIIGEDVSGDDFIELLQQEGITAEGILTAKNRPTTVKTRIIGHHQQILRIDEESDKAISAIETTQLFTKVQQIVATQKIDAIIFEDYDKGVITPTLIKAVVTLAQEHKIPTIVDPKKRNFNDYKGVTLFKPNLKELKEGLKLEIDSSIASIGKAVAQLRSQLQAEMVMVTLSELGVYIDSGKAQHHVSAHIRDITDVSGAGDTVVSVATAGLAAGLAPERFAALANLAGGLVCEKIGVVPVDKEQLLQEAVAHNV